MKGWPWKRVRMETWMLCRSCPEFHWNQFHSNGIGVSSTVLRQGQDLAEDPGKAVTSRVTLLKSWAAFPGRSFMTSQHFVLSCKGRIWDSMICTYGICRCCWNQQGAEWEICTPKYWTLPWGFQRSKVTNCFWDLWGALTYCRGSALSRGQCSSSQSPESQCGWTKHHTSILSFLSTGWEILPVGLE